MLTDKLALESVPNTRGDVYNSQAQLPDKKDPSKVKVVKTKLNKFK